VLLVPIIVKVSLGALAVEPKTLSIMTLFKISLSRTTLGKTN